MVPPPPSSSSAPPSAAGGASDHLDTRTAAIEVAEQLQDGLGGGAGDGATPDLLVVFATYHHQATLLDALDVVRGATEAKHLLACTAESVVAPGPDLEGGPAFAAVALRLPGVRIRPWTAPPEEPLPLSNPARLPEHVGADEDVRAVFLLGDPFSTPITRLLPAMNAPGGDEPLPLVGAIASGSSQPKGNVLVADDHAVRAGMVGVTLCGDVAVDVAVSQGCRPVGRAAVVTRSEGASVVELGGRPALELARETAEGLSGQDRRLLQNGLLLGTLIDENKRPFGRGDFLVRNVVGVDEERGTLAVGDTLRPGQTVQFHVRDERTAAEDLQLLLDAHAMDEAPAAGLLFTCNARATSRRRRGGGGESDADAAIAASAMAGPDADAPEGDGDARTDDAAIVASRFPGMPFAGFLAAGEIGPVGGRSHLHGHTAVLATIRPSGAPARRT